MSEPAKVVLWLSAAVVVVALAGIGHETWKATHQPRVEIGAQLRCEVVR